MKRLVSVMTFVSLFPMLALGQSIELEVLKPQFDFNDSKPTFLTTAWFATVSFPLATDALRLVVQVPFAFGELEDSAIPPEDETLGNPAIGFQIYHEHLIIDAGVRIPLADQGFAGFIGSLADIDRQEAFVPDILPLIGRIKTRINVSDFSLHPYGGISFNLKTQTEQEEVNFLRRVFGAKSDDAELFILYGGEGWWHLQKLHLGTAVQARTWITEDLTFSQRSIVQVSALARLTLGKFEPTVLFRFPLDDIILDYVVGLDAKVSF